jgi:CRP-like cAMP-binding protein
MQPDLLRRAPLFAAMPPKVVDALAAVATRKKVRKGQRVLARGDAAVVELLTGRLEVVSDSGDEVRLVRSLVPPAVVGLSVVAGAPASAELWVAEDGELAVIPADAVAAALRRYPEAAIAAIALC